MLSNYTKKQILICYGEAIIYFLLMYIYVIFDECVDLINIFYLKRNKLCQKAPMKSIFFMEK